MLQETIFARGGGEGVGSISSFLILAFFDFGTSISGQGVGVLVRVGDLEGLGVPADEEAILVRLSLIRGNGGAKGVGGAGGSVEGRRFRGIFSFNISYLGREREGKVNGVVVQGEMTISCCFAAFFSGGATKKSKFS